MIGPINSFGNVNSVNPIRQGYAVNVRGVPVKNPIVNVPPSRGTLNAVSNPYYQPNIRTMLLNGEETNMYSSLLNALNGISATNGDLTPQQKLNELLKNGKLLNSSSNDGSTTLENLYKIIATPRVQGLNALNILKTAIDAIYNPSSITQTFGDIPYEVEKMIMESPAISEKTKENMSVLHDKEFKGGTCPAASLEFHLANKKPAEFARWANELSSPKMSVIHTIKMNSLSKNFLDSVMLLNAYEIRPSRIDFKRATLELKPDKNAYIRAQIQSNYYDKGERTPLDVLIQSTIMQNASQQSYDSLTDIREGIFNPNNPQGLSSEEKTAIESIIDDKEKELVTYQILDEEGHLAGYTCSFDKMEKHIKSAIDMGEDVIIGYTDFDDKGQIWGHEFTITDYRQDKNGETIFICNDTDDEKDTLIEKKASELLPHIHHVGYPSALVEANKELMNIVAA